MPPRWRGVLLRKQHGGQLVFHVPVYVVGQHTQEDVTLDAAGPMVVDEAHLQINGLEAAEGLFHYHQLLVGSDGLFGCERAVGVPPPCSRRP